ncbi:MAG: hypothetical protein AAF566_08315 [Pseudomonadota bacterium]
MTGLTIARVSKFGPLSPMAIRRTALVPAVTGTGIFTWLQAVQLPVGGKVTVWSKRLPFISIAMVRDALAPSA